MSAYPIITSTDNNGRFYARFPKIELASVEDGMSTEALIEKAKMKIAELVRIGKTDDFPDRARYPKGFEKYKNDTVIWIWVDEDEEKKVRKNITIPRSLDRLVKATQLNLSAFVTDKLKERFRV
ncbi:hypothetical protein H5S40_04285 [Limosilactobacillus sp. RRLNB_1_1]|uniref:HicB-like antitoxin of toxin-antitoxin system domain-containing protein n=1 Tax=Limosilactobacillus albertensis TaxID=2759752 RepID=A0A7W3Y847_9LACO|nr:hypothetical protein [Limosilactobacillus albertensis]MBB1069374.1 hypothetical protein [Limosilactobacillus albertensis]MCD7118594.1 hypothetical protein [Limosilactobacillus albertensis]MCD7128361.1 hypothetical protein [Limosilactobacillus albertensis]